MSNQSRFEINHDYCDRIEDDPVGLSETLVAFLRSGAPDDAEDLADFGITYESTRLTHEGGCSVKNGPSGGLVMVCDRCGDERAITKRVSIDSMTWVLKGFDAEHALCESIPPQPHEELK